MRRSIQFIGGALLLLALAPVARAQERHAIRFPDLPGYQTLKCDFHMHTVFSDGQVWPTVRVDEAWRLGLDAIALTDHIEYQPHKNDVPTSHNRPYEIAAARARELDLLLARGAEITRDTPPGHFNAVFLSDVRPLDTPEFVDAVRQANEQHAFVFWNHQEWKGPERGRWMDVHTLLYEKHWLHGMEVANGETYYPTAHRWCLEKGLTMLGNSDIHAPDIAERTTTENHRTMTLVFVTERTLDGLKDALMAGRTVVWYQDRLIGRRTLLQALFAASVNVRQLSRRANGLTIAIRNACEANIQLQRTGGPGPDQLVLPANTTLALRLRVDPEAGPVKLAYTATNFWIEPERGLPVVLEIAGR